MKDFTSKLNQFAKERGADLVGIANIERFFKLPPQKHPSSIFPEAKSVVVLGRRITRGTLRGVEEGTQFSNYNLFGYNWLDNRFMALTTYETVEFLEDNGWEAVPLPPLPPQVPPLGVPVRENQPAPDVFASLSLKQALRWFSACLILKMPLYGRGLER